MSMLRRDVLQMAGVSCLLNAVGQTAWAQAQLETLKIITGFPPGGTSDAICRRVSEKIAPSSYAKAAFVENKTGAGGQIAIQFVRNAPADGATVLQTPMSMLGIYPHIYKKLPYDPVGDLAPVSLGAVFDFGFAVDWMRKDLGLVMEEAKSNGARLPVTALVDQFYADVQQMGGKRWDTSSLIKRLG